MPLCGFNKKMLDGIKMFADGAIEHGILDRSRQNGNSIDVQFQNEFEEMDVFIKDSERIVDPSRRKQIIGMTLMTRGIYEENQSKGVKLYLGTNNSITELYKAMDEFYYKNLGGDVRRMPELVEFINRYKR